MTILQEIYDYKVDFVKKKKELISQKDTIASI